MLRKALTCVFMIAFVGMLGSGCAKSTCDKMCDFLDNCMGVGCTDADHEDCEDDYKDEDSTCRSAMRKFADCVDDNSCGDVETGACTSEAHDVDEDC